MNPQILCALLCFGAAVYAVRKSIIQARLTRSKKIERLNVTIHLLDHSISTNSDYSDYVRTIKALLHRAKDLPAILHSIQLPNPVEQKTVNVLQKIIGEKLMTVDNRCIKNCIRSKARIPGISDIGQRVIQSRSQK